MNVFPHSVERSLCMEVKFKMGCFDTRFFAPIPYFYLLCQIILQTVEIFPCRLPADVLDKNLLFEIFYAAPRVIVNVNFEGQFSYRPM